MRGHLSCCRCGSLRNAAKSMISDDFVNDDSPNKLTKKDCWWMDGNEWIFSSRTTLMGLTRWWLWRCEGSDKLSCNYHANIKWPIKRCFAKSALNDITMDWRKADHVSRMWRWTNKRARFCKYNTLFFIQKSSLMCLISLFIVDSCKFFFETKIFLLNLKKPKRPRSHGALLTCMRVEKESDWSRARSLISIWSVDARCGALVLGLPMKVAIEKLQINRKSSSRDFVFLSSVELYNAQTSRYLYESRFLSARKKTKKKQPNFK